MIRAEIRVTLQTIARRPPKQDKKGGHNSGGNFANDPQRASEAGHKGGQNSGGNFANDPQRASEAGQKGGQNSGGNFANDREKASEAGKKRRPKQPRWRSQFLIADL